MEKSENFGFYLPSRDIDDIVDINQISDNFRVIDKELNEIDNISATVKKIDNKSIITITDKNGTVHTTEILDGQNGKDADMSLVANALKGNASGNVVALKDVSPLPHNVNIQLKNEDGSPCITETQTVIEQLKVGTDESDSYNWSDVAPDNIFRLSLPNGGVKNLKIKGLIQKIAIAPIIDGQIEVGENAEVYWINYLSEEIHPHFTAEFSIVDGVLNYEFALYYDDSYDTEQGILESWGSSYETRLGANQKITGIAIKTNEPDDSWVSLSVESLVNKDVSVKVCGKNLFKIVSNTVSGVSVSLNKNGEVVLNGTATQSNNFVTTAYIEGGTYTLSSKADKIPTSARQAFISVYNIADKTTNAVIYNYEASDKKATTELASGKYQFRIRIEGGVTYDNYTFRPQLELGNVATDYEPYIEPTTYTADENGRLTIPSMYPSMTIVADNDATMSVEYNRDINKAEFGGTADLNNYYTKNEIDGFVGDIETVLDNIIAMQNSYIGGAE